MADGSGHDFLRFLPLSQTARGDESKVRSDRGPEYAAVLDRLAELLDASPGTDVPDAAIRRLTTREVSAPSAGAPAERLRALAAAANAGGRVPVSRLSRAVLLYLDVARASSARPELEPGTSGAVALYLATSAPTEIRAVTRGHALRATDAGWEFGRGPMLEATAIELVEFLGGRSLLAPRPAPRPEAEPPER